MIYNMLIFILKEKKLIKLRNLFILLKFRFIFTKTHKIKILNYFYYLLFLLLLGVKEEKLMIKIRQVIAASSNNLRESLCILLQVRFLRI